MSERGTPPWRPLDVGGMARRVREQRLAAGLSQRKAAFPGCSAAYISRLESGDRVASGHLLEELARRINTTREYLETGRERRAICPHCGGVLVVPELEPRA